MLLNLQAGPCIWKIDVGCHVGERGNYSTDLTSSAEINEEFHEATAFVLALICARGYMHFDT